MPTPKALHSPILTATQPSTYRYYITMTRLMQNLARNDLQSLHIDRRSLWGRTKFSSSASLETMETYDSETDDESFSSSSSSSTEFEEEHAFWWGMLLSRIKAASNLQNVVINDEILSSFPTSTGTSPTPFDELLRALSFLPKLRQLRFYISERFTINYAVLKEVVKASPRLEQLILCGSSSWEEESSLSAFALSTHDEVENLASAIQDHPSLSAVSLQECYVAPELSLDPILQALSTLPKLEMINLTLTQPSVRRLSNASVVRLFETETLQDVTLWSIGLDDAHMESLLPVLPLHPSLVFLSLRCNAKITSHGWQCLLDMVQENYILRSVYTDEIVPPERESLLQNYLYWNQCGRGALLQSQDPDVWQETILRWRHDLTALYYLVRQGHACLLPSSMSK